MHGRRSVFLKYTVTFNLPIAVEFRLNTIISQMKSNIRMLIIVRAWRRRIQYCDSSRTHRWKNNVNMNNDAH